MRTAERNRPGGTPVASLKMREKWKRLSMALCAISVSDSGSPYRSQIQTIARSTALFIPFLQRNSAAHPGEFAGHWGMRPACSLAISSNRPGDGERAFRGIAHQNVSPPTVQYITRITVWRGSRRAKALPGRQHVERK